jgi:hypothetical protein
LGGCGFRAQKVDESIRSGAIDDCAPIVFWRAAGTQRRNTTKGTSDNILTRQLGAVNKSGFDVTPLAKFWPRKNAARPTPRGFR